MSPYVTVTRRSKSGTEYRRRVQITKAQARRIAAAQKARRDRAEKVDDDDPR